MSKLAVKDAYGMVYDKARLAFSEWAAEKDIEKIGGGIVRRAQHFSAIGANKECGAIPDKDLFIGMMGIFGRLAHLQLEEMDEQKREESSMYLRQLIEYVMHLATSARLDVETLVWAVFVEYADREEMKGNLSVIP